MIDRRTLLAGAGAAALFPIAAARAAEDDALLQAIAKHGYDQSRAMETLLELTEGIGGRLTCSPAAARAATWAVEKFSALGLRNVAKERFFFGLGWSHDRCDVECLAPLRATLRAVPEAWSAGTDGPVTGDCVASDAKDMAGLAALKGAVAGKVVLIGSDTSVDLEPVVIERLSDADLEKLRAGGPEDMSWREPVMKRLHFRVAADRFLHEQGARAIIWPSGRSGHLLSASGYGFQLGYERRLPHLVLTREGYAALRRHLASGAPVHLSVNVEARFHRDDLHGVNVLADLPGTGREIVMVGAHLDSWHAGTGATDNGAGVAAVIEAARLLVASGVRPARTIRFALWQGEEQGMLGAGAHVAARYGVRPRLGPKDPILGVLPPVIDDEAGPLQRKPAYARLRGYFNVDSGGGKIRGIYGGPDPARRAWLEKIRAKLAPQGVAIVSARVMEQTDDWAFRDVGLPGFGFIQDRLDYETRTHHSDLDVADYVRPDELKQMAVVIASTMALAAA